MIKKRALIKNTLFPSNIFFSSSHTKHAKGNNKKLIPNIMKKEMSLDGGVVK